MGTSPSSLLSDKCSSHKYLHADGPVDSLRAMLLRDNYIKPWSNEYMLVKSISFLLCIFLIQFTKCIYYIYIYFGYLSFVHYKTIV